MPVPRATVVYDIHDAKIYKLLTDPVGGSPTFGPAVDVPGMAEFSVDPNFVTQELKGDAKVIAKKGRADRFTVSVTYGKIALDVQGVLMGGTITDTGTTPAMVGEWSMPGTNSLQYFKMEASIEDVELGLQQVQVILYKCQLTGGTLISGATDTFGQPTLEIDAIPLDSTDQMARVRFMETKVALSA
jgi:hypothetical protein